MSTRREFIRSAGLFVAAAALLKNQAYSQYGPGRVYEAGIESDEIEDRFAKAEVETEQEQTMWCWAASISMLFAYHGYQVSQETIVERIKGIQINEPARGREISRALNSKWTSADGTEFRSKAWVFDLESGRVGRNNTDVIRELKAKRPLVYGARGHATLLTYVKYQRDQAGFPWPFEAIVRDPWPGNGGRRRLDWSEMQPIYVAGVKIE